MDTITLIFIAVGLAMDAFAVSIASSAIIGKVNKRQVFRLSFHFGLFQAMMPMIGWLAGRSVNEYIAAWDHWIAFGLLTLIGAKAIYESRHHDESGHNNHRGDPSKGFSLVMLSTATSIDALAVGLSFAVLDVAIWYPCLIIGVVTAALSLIGVMLGSRLGHKFGRKIEVAGGLVLFAIGLKILFDYLF